MMTRRELPAGATSSRLVNFVGLVAVLLLAVLASTPAAAQGPIFPDQAANFKWYAAARVAAAIQKSIKSTRGA
jgi:hypothetical protein